MNSDPFFILGAPRSGTTLLRDVLRFHPRLECPEETHIFRWGDPFGTHMYERHYKGSQLFKKHREMDGVDNFGFNHALKHCQSRKKLMEWYGRDYLRARGNPDGRWFEKTPQNVYGVLLISEFYPNAKFVHIHRHPLNVVSSLMEGKVMRKHEIWGAISSWNESAMILRQFRKINEQQIIDVPYEDFTVKPADWVRKILEFVGEDFASINQKKLKTHREKNKYRKILSKEQIELVLNATEDYRADYGY
ncbi:MAG: sulfotransferase family protein [Pseudomonadales bacterium]